MRAATKVGQDCVNEYVRQCITKLTRFFDGNGNLLWSNGEIMVGPIEITRADIQSLQEKGIDASTISEGKLRWDRFVGTTYQLLASANPDLAKSHVDAVLTIYNWIIEKRIRDADSRGIAIHWICTYERVISDFAHEIACHIGGKGIGKAFEYVMSNSVSFRLNLNHLRLSLPNP